MILDLIFALTQLVATLIVVFGFTAFVVFAFGGKVDRNTSD